jgi:hypothetical protein
VGFVGGAVGVGLHPFDGGAGLGRLDGGFDLGGGVARQDLLRLAPMAPPPTAAARMMPAVIFLILDM